MESIKASAFFSIVMGRNCFCSLCYKTVADSAVRMEDEIFVVLRNKERVEVAVADLLIEVLGEEIYNQLSCFDPICSQCLSAAISSFKFIRNCKNNIKHLYKVLHTFSMGIKDTAIGTSQDSKAAYVTLDTKRCKWNRYYSKLNYLLRPHAYQKFMLIQKQQQLLEAKKRAQVKKKVPRVNLVRLEHQIIMQPQPRYKKLCNNNKQVQKLNQNKPILTKSLQGTEFEQNKFKNSCKQNNFQHQKKEPNILRHNRKRLVEYPPHESNYAELNKLNCENNSKNSINNTFGEVLHNGLLQNVNYTGLSQSNGNSLQSKILASDVVIKRLAELKDETAQCENCGIMCDNSVELINHLKTHDTLMIMETLIKIENES